MKVLRVAILVDMSGAAGRLMLRGIGAFARASRHWNCQYHPPSAATLPRLAAWRPHGVIVELSKSAWVAPLAALRIPVIDVSDTIEKHPFPLVTHDNEAIGAAAAEYLLGRGFRNLAAVGLVHAGYAEHRVKGFMARAAAAGVVASIYRVGAATGSEDDTWGWELEDEALRAFVRTLPAPPVGVFATNDGRAIQFMEASRTTGLDVPGQAAVVGCDDDDLLCELARPPLSSVVPASEKVGYEAASLLDRMMMGQRRLPRRTLIPPVGVVTRQSSEVLAVADPDLVRALRHIRNNAHRPLRGDEVVRQVAVGRRSLERRFVAHLGHTLHDEIQRAHVAQAKQLLAHTDLAMPAVAERSGFGSLRTLGIMFRRATGQTPSAFRRANRLRHDLPANAKQSAPDSQNDSPTGGKTSR